MINLPALNESTISHHHHLAQQAVKTKQIESICNPQSSTNLIIVLCNLVNIEPLGILFTQDNIKLINVYPSETKTETIIAWINTNNQLWSYTKSSCQLVHTFDPEQSVKDMTIIRNGLGQHWILTLDGIDHGTVRAFHPFENPWIVQFPLFHPFRNLSTTTENNDKCTSITPFTMTASDKSSTHGYILAYNTCLYFCVHRHLIHEWTMPAPILQCSSSADTHSALVRLSNGQLYLLCAPENTAVIPQLWCIDNITLPECTQSVLMTNDTHYTIAALEKNKRGVQMYRIGFNNPTIESYSICTDTFISRLYVVQDQLLNVHDESVLCIHSSLFGLASLDESN